MAFDPHLCVTVAVEPATWCWTLQGAPPVQDWTGNSIASTVAVADAALLALEFMCVYVVGDVQSAVAGTLNAGAANGHVACALPDSDFVNALRGAQDANKTVQSSLWVRSVNASAPPSRGWWSMATVPVSIQVGTCIAPQALGALCAGNALTVTVAGTGVSSLAGAGLLDGDLSCAFDLGAPSPVQAPASRVGDSSLTCASASGLDTSTLASVTFSNGQDALYTAVLNAPVALCVEADVPASLCYGAAATAVGLSGASIAALASPSLLCGFTAAVAETSPVVLSNATSSASCALPDDISLLAPGSWPLLVTLGDGMAQRLVESTTLQINACVERVIDSTLDLGGLPSCAPDCCWSRSANVRRCCARSASDTHAAPVFIHGAGDDDCPAQAAWPEVRIRARLGGRNGRGPAVWRQWLDDLPLAVGVGPLRGQRRPADGPGAPHGERQRDERVGHAGAVRGRARARLEGGVWPVGGI